MSLPEYPVVVQVNWTKTTAWNPWDQANANLLCEYAGKPTLVDLSLRRGVYYPVISADTIVLESMDPDWNLVPTKADSVVAASTFKGCPIRVLRQSAPGAHDWVAKFAGYITLVKPNAHDVKGNGAKVQITAESALRYLSNQNVTPQYLPAGSPVWAPGIPNALQNLLTAAGLWQAQLINLEDPGSGWTPLPVNWGGEKVQFGQALVDLAYLDRAAVRCLPVYATASGQSDWVIKWWRPRFGSPVMTLSSPLGDVWTGATVQWADEGVP